MKTIFKIFSIVTSLLLILVAIFSFYFKDELYNFYRDKILGSKNNIVIEKNEYYKDNNYLYVSNTNNFIVKNEQEILNVFYTIINSGVDKFMFYCDDDYALCIDDVKEIASNQNTLSNINNFVHPYNSFKSLNTTYNNHGEVIISITKNYSNEEIKEINAKVDQILAKEINDEMNIRERIKAIHNYIINNSKYASIEYQEKHPEINYSNASGVLIYGQGLCGSYADAMAIFLERMNFNNYKISSEKHIWNLVYFDDKWLHLDLTWDDPVTSDDSDRLEVLFFLITDTRLKELNVEQHNYDKNVYLELKK